MNIDELGVKAAAEYLGYSHNTLNIARHTGRLAGREGPKFFKRGYGVKYKKSSCDEWLDDASVELTKNIKD